MVGVQGGVLSPLLFSVYIDDLMNALESHGMGCCIGQKFCGAAGYADDIILLCPTSSGAGFMNRRSSGTPT